MNGNVSPIEAATRSDSEVLRLILHEMRELNAMLRPLAELANRSRPLFKFPGQGR